jgi:predicted DNA-binding transcriptional regulator AlpA
MTSVVEAPTSTSPGRLYSAYDFAALLGITPKTVREWANDGRLPKGLRFGPRVRRWTAADIQAALAQRGA